MFIQTIKRKCLFAIAAIYRYWQWRRVISLTVFITFFSSTVSPALAVAADPAAVAKNKTSSNKVSAIKENSKSQAKPSPAEKTFLLQTSSKI